MKKRMLAPWLLAVGVCLALAAPSVVADDSLTRSFPFRSGDLLVVDVHKGHVEVETGDVSEVTVTVTVEHGDVEDWVDLSFETDDGLRVIGRKGPGGEGKKRSGISRWFGGGDDDDGDIEYQILAPRRMDLEVSSGGGHIGVDDVEGRVAVNTGGGHIEVQDIQGSLEIRTGGGHIEAGDIDGPVEVSTGGGHVDVQDVRGEVTLKTGGGHIEVGDVDGDLKVRTGGGHISADDVAGLLDLESGGGNIEADGAGSDAKIHTGGGNVHLGEMGGHVLVRTGGGDIEVALAAGNDAGVDLETDDGDIELGVPGGMGFRLEARADDGEVETRLRVEGRGGRSPESLEGDIGRGGSLLRVITRDGDIPIYED